MTYHFANLTSGQKQSPEEEKLPTGSIRVTVFSFLTLGFALVAVFCLANYLSQDHSPNSQSASRSLRLYDKEQQGNVEFGILLEQLSAIDEDQRNLTKKRIIQLAQQSEENRNIVVAELLKRVQVPGFKYQLGTASASYFLESVTQLFDELKVIEAVDFLVDCIDCTAVHRYASETYRHKPAVRALMGLKELAIPKLAETLYHPDPDIRIYAALCLSNIGGEAARESLSYAFRGESDARVRFYIKGAIQLIDRNRRER